ncbi:hypothetical protein QJS10_CPB11g01248 [Acorus calamus]|nr:hypothetical protein QJS10_CPB11g01248 [Acorus calamus]
MASSQNTKPETQPAPVAGAAMTSCRKKKSESASFIEDLKDHADEFFNASWDEHKTCFQKTVNKMFASLKNVTEKSSVTAGPKEVESALPLQTTVSK